MINFRHVISTLTVLLCSLNIGCSSNGPKTQFYGLFPLNQQEVTNHFNIATDHSIGVGPIVLADYLDNPAIVTRTNNQQIRVSGFNAWAGDLKSQITRVTTNNLSALLQSNHIWAFPWDTRTRPRYQLAIVVDDLSGMLGGDLHLQIKYSLLDTATNTFVFVESTHINTVTTDTSHNSYVSAINMALNQWSIELAKRLSDTKL